MAYNPHPSYEEIDIAVEDAILDLSCEAGLGSLRFARPFGQKNEDLIDYLRSIVLPDGESFDGRRIEALSVEAADWLRPLLIGDESE